MIPPRKPPIFLCRRPVVRPTRPLTYPMHIVIGGCDPTHTARDKANRIRMALDCPSFMDEEIWISRITRILEAYDDSSSNLVNADDVATVIDGSLIDLRSAGGDAWDDVTDVQEELRQIRGQDQFPWRDGPVPEGFPDDKYVIVTIEKPDESRAICEYQGKLAKRDPRVTDWMPYPEALIGVDKAAEVSK